MHSHEEERRFVKAQCLAVSEERFQRAIKMEEEGYLHEAAALLRRAIEAEEDAHHYYGAGTASQS